MSIGNARVSLGYRRLVLQQDALTIAGRERIFAAHAAGAEGTGSEQAVAFALNGNTIVLRHDKTRRNGSRAACLAMGFKLMDYLADSSRSGPRESTQLDQTKSKICYDYSLSN